MLIEFKDDLPPGIDEPSLPGLPGFDTPHYSPPPPHPATTITSTSTDPNPHSHPQPDHPDTCEVAPTPPDGDHDNPPSFAASEAAQAVGGVALAQPAPRQRAASVQRPIVHTPQAQGGGSEAPPGYFGAAGGLPPYSQG